jgi:hypothetical protein
MLSSAGKIVRDVSETCEPQSSESFSNMQVSNLEPQELTEFLDFCAGKIAMAQQGLELT